MEEIWKTIPILQGDYEASNLGRIRSTFKVIYKSDGTTYTRISKILKPALSGGYFKVGVSMDKKLKSYPVHRLVAFAFIDNPENKATVNHKNGIKTDNNVNNLEWMTFLENVKHCHENNLQTPFKGEEIGNSKLKEWQVLEIRSKYKPFETSLNQLAKEYNVSKRNILDIVKRRIWKHLP